MLSMPLHVNYLGYIYNLAHLYAHFVILQNLNSWYWTAGAGGKYKRKLNQREDWGSCSGGTRKTGDLKSVLGLAACALKSKSHFLLLLYLLTHKNTDDILLASKFFFVLFFWVFFVSLSFSLWTFWGERCVLLEDYVELSTKGLVRWEFSALAEYWKAITGKAE